MQYTFSVCAGWKETLLFSTEGTKHKTELASLMAVHNMHGLGKLIMILVKKPGTQQNRQVLKAHDWTPTDAELSHMLP